MTMFISAKKAFALIFTSIYLLSFIPVLAEDVFASPPFLEDFESSDSADNWAGGVRDSVAAYEGSDGLAVCNPFGDFESDLFGHIAEYYDYISFEEGKFYTFSAWVMNPMADDIAEPSAQAYIGDNVENLYIDISSVGSDWSYVTASFTVSEDMLCRPLISVYGGEIDIGFFIDSISITEETRLPEYALIDGPESVFIPDFGARTYRYSIAAYDADGEKVNVLMDSYSFSITDLPDGIEFDEKFWFDGTYCTLLTFKDNVVIKEEADVHCGGYGYFKPFAFVFSLIAPLFL